MIIRSLLDTDLYKLTMGQVALHQFSGTIVRYKFKCRNDIEWNIGHLVRIKEEIQNFCSLRFTDDELKYLSDIRFFKSSYIDFLKFYRPDPDHISVKLVDKELQIEVEGPWFLTVYWEVPLLAIVSEVYTEHLSLANFPRALERLNEKRKIAEEAGLTFADFGTRRRFSREWHDLVIENLKDSACFTGTSNIFLAKKYGVKPIGTMAHEFLQVGQAIDDVPLIGSQKRMLQAWVDEYRGDLGIALTDVIGIHAFLRDFDLYFAKLYDGLRHDSGPPEMWASLVIQYYKDIGIDPRTKTLVFSDGLNFEKAAKLHKAYSGMAKTSFGIGTNLTNDIGGLTPPQIVIKIVECNGRPVAKISDSPGKGMCEDEDFVQYLKKVFRRD